MADKGYIPRSGNYLLHIDHHDDMMATRKGPKDQIPQTMGSSTIVAFNWLKINAHKEAFFKEQQGS